MGIPAMANKDYGVVLQFPNLNNAPMYNQVEESRSDSYSTDFIHSYNDILSMQTYFYNKKKYRNLMLLDMGIATGLRISDLLSLKISDVLACTTPVTFKDAVYEIEQKTGKKTYNQKDRVLITEICKKDICLYLSKLKKYDMNDYLFRSQKINKDGEYVLSRQQAFTILNDAKKAIGIKYRIAPHSLRRTFVNVVLELVDHSDVNLNSASLLVAQIMLRHNNATTTMVYAKRMNEITSEVRNKISDFLLGKTNINSLQDKINFDV